SSVSIYELSSLAQVKSTIKPSFEICAVTCRDALVQVIIKKSSYCI
ncbi:3006_t:CDS:1, partial [Racocetra persica]